MDWNTFKQDIDPRFVTLSIEDYQFRLDFPPFDPLPDELLQITRSITGAVVDSVKKHNPAALYHLDVPKPNADTHFQLRYGHPVYDISVDFRKTRLTLAKTSFTLEDLVMSVPMIRDIINQLFGKTSRNSLTNFSFFGDIYRTVHSFSQRVVLSSRISDPTESVNNSEIMLKHFLRNDGESALDALQADGMGRSEVIANVSKVVGGRPASIWIDVDTPTNVLLRDVILNLSMRRGEADGKLVDADFFEVEVVMQSFYRDLIINRLYKLIFKDIAIQASPR